MVRKKTAVLAAAIATGCMIGTIAAGFAKKTEMKKQKPPFQMKR